ncbi:SDR family oxidoreductase [Alisedimentitalea sp. MJ-SS2]|uniref:SDR family NAD(P)-dependent oxidoreductase n=1 Tax=Aliisedimentitalea sp. MJ-SS2 TaxID=3049795 RepID=UPI002913EAF8|nr:SDR family oxidoreductase [Alisedimentitalea sp. MJ-SS2]MDU8928047.1 SDR family oxidoreductase [Alisedimentitalea sp. MJ-SS2]
MEIQGKVAVVTGAAQGIGRALCVALKEAGAAHVVAVDLKLQGAQETADMTSGTAMACDVGDQTQMEAMIDRVEDEIGPIDLFCSNAGILTGLDESFDNIAFASTEEWNKAWAVNVMAHVHAARHLIPKMKARGGGYFMHTASAAGLLNQVGSAVYGVTKHAAVGFAEALALGHKDDNIRVTVLCPQGVDTEMVRGAGENPATADGILSTQRVAEDTLQAIRDEKFLVLPHENVAGYMQNKVQDYDRWIGGMAKLQRYFKAAQGKG